MTDAEREELKTLIRETIREMAKEAGDIMWATPVPNTPWTAPWPPVVTSKIEPMAATHVTFCDTAKIAAPNQ